MKILAVVLLFTNVAMAQNTTRSVIEKISVKAESEEQDIVFPDLPGSAHKITKKQIEESKSSNVHEIIQSVPGVYIQQEDAEGLRPNIGLRGAHPHRSEKITLLEDGILIAPAPYSAPSAYYFPAMDNMEGLEVFKGPSASRYGPNSIGGVVNLLTREYPMDQELKASLQLGQYNSQKMDFKYGKSNSNLQWLVHATGLRSDGFKQLPSDEAIGHERLNTGFKVRKKVGEGSYVEGKFNFSGENSMETYLGLSDSDFADNSLQRYAASQDDEFNSGHKTFQLNYSTELGEDSSLSATVYRHNFDRVWSKVNKFADGTSLGNVVNDPTGNGDYYNILRGERDSLSADEELVFGIIDRSYVSEGLQVDSSIGLPTGSVVKEQYIDVGLRFHQDNVDRDHSLENFNMVDGDLISVDGPRVDTSGQKVKRSRSASAYVNHNIEVGNFTVSSGARFDHIRSTQSEKLKFDERARYDNLFTPGVAAAYDFGSNQVFAGVHKGMNLVGPGQNEEIQPEEALNYEMGYRLRGTVNFEAIGFFSDYTNIQGNCTAASGCDLADIGNKFNGGAAEVYGLELMATSTPKYKAWAFPIKASATSTKAYFANSFVNEKNKAWGKKGETIEEGDPLPYIPNIQAQLSMGVKRGKWLAAARLHHQGRSYDQALRASRKTVEGFNTLGFLTEFKASEKQNYYLKADNIFDESYVVSFRPNGARPGKPLSVYAGTTILF